jgi:hypothetical protein
MFKLVNSFFNRKHIDVIAVSKEELDKLTQAFFISRTGVEVFDASGEDMSPKHIPLPKVFEEVYAKNQQSATEYEALDEQLIKARESSSNMSEYREKAEKLHYSNCTGLACFLYEALNEKGIDAKIFGLGGAHHFVIAQDESPHFIVASDPWAHVQFKMAIEQPVKDLADLSGQDRLLIAKKHYEATGLYPDYKEVLQKLLSQDPNMSDNSKEKYTKMFFEISTTERFFEFDPEPEHGNPECK